MTNASELVGRTIGGTYRIVRKLGEGGMGAVYEAVDNIDRKVALKVMKPEFAKTKDFADRFKREAMAAAKFKHPNSVDVYNFGQDGDVCFLALEYVSGRELRDVIRENGALPPLRAADIALQVLAALEKAHAAGIVHRDMKPQNVMIASEDGRDVAKILDFGIAKMKDASGPQTQLGTIMGTVAYMSPEQARGEVVDGRSDLYSVGIILYQMLTGEVPFTGKSSMELIKKQIEQAPPPLRTKHAEIPVALEQVVMKALAKRREDRYQDARSFAKAIESSKGEFEKTLVGAHATGALVPDPPPPPEAPTRSAPVTPVPTTAPPRVDTALSYEEGGTAAVYAGLVGRTIDDKYEVQSKLGEGGMGAVFKARHKLLDKLVALKVVHPALSERPDVRERFLREAKAAMVFVHPNAIPVRDFGVTKDGLVYMTQDFSPGKSLRAILSEKKRLEPPRALAIARQCLLALAEAHQHGIVHRDFKPENVLVERDETTGDDVARVCDFGIAKLNDAHAAQGPNGESLTGRSVIGTPHYMAPEQASGEKVDGRADIYAVGCVLYELVTGTKVFEADSVMKVLMKQISTEPDAPRKRLASVPPAVEVLILRALAKAPASRFANCEEMVEAIDGLGIELPGRILGRTKGGKTHPGFTTVNPPAGHGLARVAFLLLLVTLLAAGGFAIFYPAFDARVPEPLRPMLRKLLNYKAPDTATPTSTTIALTPPPPPPPPPVPVPVPDPPAPPPPPPAPDPRSQELAAKIKDELDAAGSLLDDGKLEEAEAKAKDLAKDVKEWDSLPRPLSSRDDIDRARLADLTVRVRLARFELRGKTFIADMEKALDGKDYDTVFELSGKLEIMATDEMKYPESIRTRGEEMRKKGNLLKLRAKNERDLAMRTPP
ncbi:MAG TPA: protein kinase, partial [Planctomycetota bacterium]|nr:protein kinase [Planctomycetota bacterium]